MPDHTNNFVADASVWINLEATGRAVELLRVIRGNLVITDMAVAELERGRTKGRRAADEVAALAHLGLVQIVRCPAEHDDLLLGLVSGPARDTLDDGEAATLVFAHSTGAVALIDERKATTLAAKRFPHLVLRTTTDLLLAPEVLQSLGDDVVADALHRALFAARMRVPEHHMETVLRMIGPDRARGCVSLPAAHRSPAADVMPDLPIR